MTAFLAPLASAPLPTAAPTPGAPLEAAWIGLEPSAPLLLQGDAPLPAAPPGQGDSTQGAPPAGGGGFGSLLPFLLIGVVFWFLIIGPERKNRKKREAMLAALQKGDRVMTTGGLYGRVVELRDDVVVLDAGDTRLKFSRAAIQGVLEGEDAKEAKG